MDYKKIVEQTKADGGYTHSKGGRYVVAVPGFEKIVPLDEFNTDILKYYVSYVGEEFGTWIDGNTVTLDKVECIHKKELALKLGKQRNEKAIYDLLEKKEIRLK